MTIETYGGAGDAAGRIDSFATCDGSRLPKCIPEVEEMWKHYQTSTDPKDRERLVEEIQNYRPSENELDRRWV